MWKVKIHSSFGQGYSVIYADEVDFTHMPIVSINGIKDMSARRTIVLPNEGDSVEMAAMDPLYVPYTSLIYAGELTDPAEILRFELKAILKDALGSDGGEGGC
jgi:hypothetical protein